MLDDGRYVDVEGLLQLIPALKSKRGQRPDGKVRWLLRRRDMPHLRIGRRVIFDVRDVEAWLESQKIPAQGVSK